MNDQKYFQGRILALDLGDKRIGVAMSDELGWTAQPLMVFERTNLERDLEKISKSIEEYQIKKIVVGLPISLSGKITVQTQKVLDLVEIFKQKWATPIETWDESLSTKSAEAILIEANMSRKKRKKVIDKVAAVFILQSYLEAHR